MADLIRSFRDLDGYNVFLFQEERKGQRTRLGACYGPPMMPGNKWDRRCRISSTKVFALSVSKRAMTVLLCVPSRLTVTANGRPKDRSGRLDMWEEPDLPRGNNLPRFAGRRLSMAKKEALMVSDAAALKEGMQAWLEAKEREQLAIDERREIEDYLTNAMFALSEDFEGSQSLTLDDYKLTVTGRMNRKVDADRVQELAREHGLTAAIEDPVQLEGRCTHDRMAARPTQP